MDFDPHCRLRLAPGRVVRAMTPEEIERNKGSALNYVQNARRFAAGLAPA